MKELSIEEKARAYDKAIEIAKEYFDSPRTCIDINVLPKLFPELKESEDERTWIINYLSNRILNSTIIAEKENLKKAVAWLERQGEQKPAEWSEEDAKTLNRISAILVDASEVKNWWKESRLIEREEMVRLTDFLKSFKDRYAFKPSKEQIMALRWVLNHIPYSSHKEEINGLLEQYLKGYKNI